MYAHDVLKLSMDGFFYQGCRWVRVSTMEVKMDFDMAMVQNGYDVVVSGAL